MIKNYKIKFYFSNRDVELNDTLDEKTIKEIKNAANKGKRIFFKKDNKTTIINTNKCDCIEIKEVL